ERLARAIFLKSSPRARISPLRMVRAWYFRVGRRPPFVRLPGGEAMTHTPKSLLERLRARQDQADWARFAGLFGPILLAWVQRRLHLPREDARDVCQEVLLALLRALPKGLFDAGQGPFRAWLWRVAQNKAREFRRKQGRAPRLLGGDEAQR